MPIGYVNGTSCVNPIDNSVFLVGGEMYIPDTATINFRSPSVYIFNSNLSLWTTTDIIGFNSSFKMRNAIQSVIDKYGNIYSFGGTNYTDNTGNSSFVVYNDMSILDTTFMTWSTLPISVNAPPPYLLYTATLLSTGIIVYIGGRMISSDNPETSMYEIQTFNANDNSWSTKVASGNDNIKSRVGHSAVLMKLSSKPVYIKFSRYSEFINKTLDIMNFLKFFINGTDHFNITRMTCINAKNKKSMFILK
ncbi:hypothetical protein C2G38_1307490 [Gigaspora rosea]|uniref:Kelch repeat protein n=1 Tax=Gigaspora rosea TaxID=44941 RepID=A0A397V960_9GLOM|nr:hypothetical protein C2G38_1307490 [Gigaspora rosea]